MPLKEHKVFSPSPDPDGRLWRYMSVSKFLSLLQRKCLFFANLELMARSDPFEGVLPASRFVHRAWNSIDDVPEEIRVKIRRARYARRHEVETDTLKLKRYKEIAELRIRQAYLYRKSCFINCWHINDAESAAMWDIYSHRNEGIAIVSSENLLRRALEKSKLDIYCGVVQYDDYNSSDFVIEDGNALSPVIFKRNSFSYEAEYRLVYWDTSVTHKRLYSLDGYIEHEGLIFEIKKGQTMTVGRTEAEIEKLEIRPGHYIECEINSLIKEIFVSPLAPSWFLEMVGNVAKTYNCSAEIKQSDIFAQPLK